MQARITCVCCTSDQDSTHVKLRLTLHAANAPAAHIATMLLIRGCSCHIDQDSERPRTQQAIEPMRIPPDKIQASTHVASRASRAQSDDAAHATPTPRMLMPWRCSTSPLPTFSSNHLSLRQYEERRHTPGDTTDAQGIESLCVDRRVMLYFVAAASLLIAP